MLLGYKRHKIIVCWQQSSGMVKKNPTKQNSNNNRNKQKTANEQKTLKQSSSLSC